MSDILFTGCSYTAGSGWEDESHNPNLWVNLLHASDRFRHHRLHNSAKGGRSNQGIFLDTVYNLTRNNYKYAFVAWTSYPRYDMMLGLETYTTWQSFMPNGRFRDHNLCDGVTLDAKYLQKINDRFTVLAHPYYEILNIIKYVNSLVHLSKTLGVEIFFINALCDWDQDFFHKKSNVLPEKYTNYTKKLLDMDRRDDDEIFVIYDKMHDEYSAAGGIQQQHWLNLYQSLGSMKIDTNQDQVHPGILSNLNYFRFIDEQLSQRI